MKVLQRASITTFALIGLVSAAMAGDQGGINLTPAQRVQLGNAKAADLPAKAPPMPVRVWSWTGFYGGVFGGGTFANSGSYSLTADPTAVNGISVGPAASGGFPIIPSAGFTNLAAGGIGQISNLINPTGNNCVGLVNCNVGGFATTAINPSFNLGSQTSAMLPTSRGISQDLAGLGGLEIGYRRQFDRVVLGIGADISIFAHSSTNYTSIGSFFNTNGFTATSSAVGCLAAVAATCTQVATLNATGSAGTVNSGTSAVNLSLTNPNWVGTVRGSLGYAFDRLLIFGSAGLAYSDAVKLSGSYTETFTSACSGVAGATPGNSNGVGNPGVALVNFACGPTPLNSGSVTQVTTTSVMYSGNHGGMLTGFAAGTGGAYAITDHVALTIEGLYYNLGTVRTTVTTSGSQTSTITGPGPTTTTTAAVTATPFTVSRTIDGFIFKGGVQYKF
jgi:hypothetical protein